MSDTATLDRLAEWSQWRGSVDTKQDSIPGQIQAIADGLNRRLDDLHTLGVKTHEQTLKTNGRVNRHDVELAELRASSRAQGQVQEAQSRVKTTLVESFRFRIMAGAAYMAAGAGLIAGLNALGLL